MNTFYRLQRVLVAALCLLCCAALALAGEPEPRPGLSPELSKEALGNYIYRCGLNADLALAMRNGLYDETIAIPEQEGGGSYSVYANLVLAAHGSLPIPWIDAASETDVAAVVYTFNTGGTGFFYMLSVLGPCTGMPLAACELACAPLGDRVQIQSLAVENGLVSMDMVVHGEQDPACCPTKHVTKAFALETGELHEFAATPAE